MTLSWDAIGAIAELLGAMGVICSLIYLGVQIRQNSKHVESSVYQSTNDVFVDFYAMLAADPVLADIWYKELLGENVREEHSEQAKALLSVLFLAFENNYQHYRSGVVVRDALLLPGISRILSEPFVVGWLKNYGVANLSPEFLRALDEILMEGQ